MRPAQPDTTGGSAAEMTRATPLDLITPMTYYQQPAMVRYARSIYAPVSVLILTFSPTLIKVGTVTL